ncbi:MAG: hypothetical protein KKH28_08720 [Elusimicrobia bacterium]|nr:hypothetical protein [Elusimicrobiota bacterium]
MSYDKDDNSLSPEFKKEPPPPAADARIQSLETELRDLKAEFNDYKTRPLPPPTADARVQPLEAALGDLKTEFDDYKTRLLSAAADARIQPLEAALKDLKAESGDYKIRPLPPPAADARVQPPEAAPGDLKAESGDYQTRPLKADPELLRRLERAESVIEELRGELAAAEDRAGTRAGAAASKDELKNLDLRMTDLSSAFGGLKRTLASEEELAASLAERSESSLTELKTAFYTQQSQVKKSLEALTPRRDIEALRVSVSGALFEFEELKRQAAEYSEEFSRIEHECRKALGEMQGYARSAKEQPLTGRFDEHLKNSVSRLNAKLAEVETSMHAALAELSGRLNADRVLYAKIFTEAEDRIKKSVEPEMQAEKGQLKWLHDNVIWLMDEYKVVTERKIRALEGKCSVFEAISRRMDAISEELEKRKK